MFEIMELEEAIGILKVYNLWRRDNTGYIEMSITLKS